MKKPTLAELDNIRESGESYFIEFKEQVNSSIAKELVAFSNASGGRIFIGITDKGQIKGIKNSNSQLSKIQDIATNCHPSIIVDIDQMDNILILNVAEGQDKPYQCSDGFFIRMGANSQKMKRDQIIDFLKVEGKVKFEQQFHPKFDLIKHYDSKKLDGFLHIAGITKNLDDYSILENLGVIEIVADQLKMKNIGVLFFAKSIELLCEQATITCAVFDGTERISVLNRKDYQDDLITNINNALHFMKQALRVRYEMTEEAQRKEIYEIPIAALREIIVNAVAHRDYFQTGCHTTVEVFDDRIEITNPGGLPKGLTVADFGKKAVRRNPMIAALLQRVKLVENMGTGINKIRQLAKSAGISEPEFTFSNFSTVCFKRERLISN